MNVVILTPDSVGSTLLQRALTIQMLLSDFDRPVINLHELSNGIFKYFNYELNSMVLGKRLKHKSGTLGYSQSLPKIVELLESVDHYVTSRLAHYHLLRRTQDTDSDRSMFFEYLNNNFYIIAAKRRNLLDYALSWVLRSVHKRLNVYTDYEKVVTYYDLFKEPIKADTELLTNFFESYKTYIEWTNLFEIGSNFYYEDHVPNLENYILSLPIFAGKKKRTWNETYNLTFQEYNVCRKSMSDIGSIALQNNNDLKLLTFDDSNKKNIGDIVLSRLPAETQSFVAKHRSNYDKANNSIDHMVKLGLLVSSIPIKKNTFEEKKHLILNFNECVDVYNEWIIKNPYLGNPIDNDKLLLSIDKDNSTWQVTE